MNCNEVICNLAAEKLGSVKGDYKRVSPNDHANFGQSTNDTYPTALHLALLLRSNVLLEAVEHLVGAFYKRLTSSAQCSRWDVLTCRMQCQ